MGSTGKSLGVKLQRYAHYLIIKRKNFATTCLHMLISSASTDNCLLKEKGITASGNFGGLK